MPRQKVNNNDMWVLLLSTIRYSFGRRTYMSSLSGELVLRYKHFLTKQQLEQIAEEIENELKLSEAQGVTLGMDIDHRAWQTTLRQIREVLDQNATQKIQNNG